MLRAAFITSRGPSGPLRTAAATAVTSAARAQLTSAASIRNRRTAFSALANRCCHNSNSSRANSVDTAQSFDTSMQPRAASSLRRTRWGVPGNAMVGVPPSYRGMSTSSPAADDKKPEEVNKLSLLELESFTVRRLFRCSLHILPTLSFLAQNLSPFLCLLEKCLKIVLLDKFSTIAIRNYHASRHLRYCWYCTHLACFLMNAVRVVAC